jgi:glycosyltransferase involved in cell wall biosynthesis
MSQATRQPLVSIITPVYNGAAYLEDLILSVKAQAYPQIEHLILDDGSRDEDATVKILERYPHLRWWTRENRGQYATMNEGLAAARGEIICFISADDLLAPRAVQAALDWLGEHPEAAGVYGFTEYQTETGERLSIKRLVRSAPIQYYPYFAQVQHCSLYLRKDFILAQELTFNPEIKFVADYDWIIRIIKTGAKLGFLERSLSIIRVHGEQTSSLNRQAMNTAQFQVAREHGYGGLKFTFYLNLLHVLILSEQIWDAFQKNGLRGALGALTGFWKNKLLPALRRRFSKNRI